MTDLQIDNQATDVILVITSVPDAETSGRLARSLVNDGLAACVHAMPAGESTYRWQGQVHTDRETTLFIKTVRGHGDAVARRVHDVHPYELPELLIVPIHGGSTSYLDWVRGQTPMAVPPKYDAQSTPGPDPATGARQLTGSKTRKNRDQTYAP